MAMSEQVITKFLSIDRTKTMPIQGVVEGKRIGTTRMLDWHELSDYAKWLGLFGGRDLLDAFEVALINDGMLYVWPIDEEGMPLHGECDAVEIIHYDDGSRIVWEPKLQCDVCCGAGHHALSGEPVEEEDICIYCDGNGHTFGEWFETDMNGNPIQQTKEQPS